MTITNHEIIIIVLLLRIVEKETRLMAGLTGKVVSEVLIERPDVYSVRIKKRDFASRVLTSTEHNVRYSLYYSF